MGYQMVPFSLKLIIFRVISLVANL